MPRINYDYKCEKCEHLDNEVREMEQRNEPKECPKCKGNMKLKIGNPPFKFMKKY